MSDVSWSWEADVKKGMLEGFKANVVAPWNAVAEPDEDTLGVLISLIKSIYHFVYPKPSCLRKHE